MMQRKELSESAGCRNIPCVALAVVDLVALALWLSNLSKTFDDDEIEKIDEKYPVNDPL